MREHICIKQLFSGIGIWTSAMMPKLQKCVYESASVGQCSCVADCSGLLAFLQFCGRMVSIYELVYQLNIYSIL